MTSLRINLKSRKDPIYASCDRYEVVDKGVGDFVEKWLVVYREDKETGQYRYEELLGYDEYE